MFRYFMQFLNIYLVMMKNCMRLQKHLFASHMWKDSENICLQRRSLRFPRSATIDTTRLKMVFQTSSQPYKYKWPRNNLLFDKRYLHQAARWFLGAKRSASRWIWAANSRVGTTWQWGSLETSKWFLFCLFVLICLVPEKQVRNRENLD